MKDGNDKHILIIFSKKGEIFANQFALWNLYFKKTLLVEEFAQKYLVLIINSCNEISFTSFIASEAS